MLQLVITSTHGDPHFLGLAGIELFAPDGCVIPLKSEAVSAAPFSINDLSEYSQDPRVPGNLVLGPMRTSDDTRMWLCPFLGTGRRHTVSISLSKPTEVAAVRVWNYNKGRVHLLRGAKDAAIVADGRVLWAGTLNPAPGSLDGAAGAASLILLSPDAGLRDRIAAVDVWHEFVLKDQSRTDPPALFTAGLHGSPHPVGPSPAPASNTAFHYPALGAELAGASHAEAALPHAAELAGAGEFLSAAALAGSSHLRPFTSAGALPSEAARAVASAVASTTSGPDVLSAATPAAMPAAQVASVPQPALPQSPTLPVTSLVLRVLSQHGDPFYFGLNALRFLNASGEVISDSAMQAHGAEADAEPRDLNTVDGHSGDVRTPDKILGPGTVTTSPAECWLAPTTLDPSNRPQTVTVTLRRPIDAAGIRLWNYNRTRLVDTARGVCRFLLFAQVAPASAPGNTGSGSLLLLSPPEGFQLRRAPGHTRFDFGASFFFRPEFHRLPLRLPDGAVTSFGRLLSPTGFIPDGDALANLIKQASSVPWGSFVFPLRQAVLPTHLLPHLPAFCDLTITVSSTHQSPVSATLGGVDILILPSHAVGKVRSGKPLPALARLSAQNLDCGCSFAAVTGARVRALLGPTPKPLRIEVPPHRRGPDDAHNGVQALPPSLFERYGALSVTFSSPSPRTLALLRIRGAADPTGACRVSVSLDGAVVLVTELWNRTEPVSFPFCDDHGLLLREQGSMLPQQEQNVLLLDV
jgi:hypothetical protein